MKYSNIQRLQFILEHAEKLLFYVAEHHISKEKLLNDYAVQWLVTTPLMIIGEQAYQLSQDYKDDHPGIPWGAIAGLRHRLVHHYYGTNRDRIADVLFEDLPVLAEQIRALLSEEGQS